MLQFNKDIRAVLLVDGIPSATCLPTAVEFWGRAIATLIVSDWISKIYLLNRHTGEPLVANNQMVFNLWTPEPDQMLPVIENRRLTALCTLLKVDLFITSLPSGVGMGFKSIYCHLAGYSESRRTGTPSYTSTTDESSSVVDTQQTFEKQPPEDALNSCLKAVFSSHIACACDMPNTLVQFAHRVFQSNEQTATRFRKILAEKELLHRLENERYHMYDLSSMEERLRQHADLLRFKGIEPHFSFAGKPLKI